MSSEVFVPLKYVLFQWRNSITLKKDPLAKGWFKSQMTLPGLFTMLGSPLPLYEASVGHRALELFLADEQCVVLRAGLASLMGPTRADNSWKAESNLPREKLSGWRRRTFANARELEQKMGELQLAEDATSTLGAYQELVRLRGIWSALKAKGKGSFLACDVETYEFNHDLLTEFGWSTLVNDARQDVHVVVAENASKRNGRWCPDARDHYDFGKTVTIPQADLHSRLSKLIDELSTDSPLFMIMHDPRSDITALNLLGIDTSSYSRQLNAFSSASPPTSGVFILDTQAIFCGWSRAKRKAKLELCCEELSVPTRRLHNAGNDAHYTLALLEAMLAKERDGSAVTGDV